MNGRSIPWPVRSVIAGAAGTAAMTLAYATEHRLRPQVRGSLDYDDSRCPARSWRASSDSVTSAIAAMRNRCRAEVGVRLRVRAVARTLRRFFPEPWASVVFGATLMSATFTLFPVLGERLHRGDGTRTS